MADMILGQFQVEKKGLTPGEWNGNPYQPEVHPASFFCRWKRRRNEQKLQRRKQRKLAALWYHEQFFILKQFSVIPHNSNNFAILLCHVIVRKAQNP